MEDSSASRKTVLKVPGGIYEGPHQAEAQGMERTWDLRSKIDPRNT